MSIESSTYTVSGMTCAHCVLSVKEEIGEIPGVQAVEVDLATGRVDVAGANVREDRIRDAVAQAGYDVIS